MGMDLASLQEIVDHHADTIKLVADKLGDGEDITYFLPSEFNGLDEEFIFNAEILQTARRRKDGSPYITHPATMVVLADHLLKDYLTPEQIDVVKKKALRHDTREEGWYEDGTHSRAGEFLEFRAQHTPEKQEALDDMVLFGHDKAWENGWRKACTVHQIKEYGTELDAYTWVIDKLHNAMDMDYLEGSEDRDEKMIKKFVAPLLYSLDSLAGMMDEGFGEDIRLLAHEIIRDKDLDQGAIDDYVSELKAIEKAPEVPEMSRAYLTSNGYTPLIQN